MLTTQSEVAHVPTPLAPAPGPTLLVLGRLTPNNRPHDVVAAFELVRAEYPDAQLWLVGDGPLLGVLRRIRVDGVTAWGRVDEATEQRLIGAAHLLVASSVPGGSRLVAENPQALAGAIIDKLRCQHGVQ